MCWMNQRLRTGWMRPNMTNKDRAKTAVNRIIDSLTNRSGLGNAWDYCDDDVRMQIREEWEEIIVEAMRL